MKPHISPSSRIRRVAGAGLAIALTLGVIGTASAQETNPSPIGIKVDRGWTTVTTAAGKTTPAYFAIHNEGTTPDTLVSTTCPIAHHTVLYDASGHPLGAIVIKPGQTITMGPDGLHLMLQANRYRFYAHGMIPCSVDFLDAGKLIMYLHVEPHGAKGYERVRRPVIKN